MFRHARSSSRHTTAGELKHLVATAERTLAKLPSHASELRSRLSDVVDSGRESLANLRDKARDGMERADETVRAHPYPTIGIAAAVGALVGYFFARSQSNRRWW